MTTATVVLRPETAKLYYEESKGAKEYLDKVFAQYRSNTSVVLTLATGATTLFGFADSGAGVFRWLTLGAYAVAVASALSMFVPRKWPFNVASDLRSTISELGIEKLHYDLAIAYQRQIDEAREVIRSSQNLLPSFRVRFIVLVVAAALTVGFGAASIAAAKPAPEEPTRVLIVKE